MSLKALTPLVLPANPTNPLEAATKQYVDAAFGAEGAWTVMTPLSSPWIAGTQAPRYRLEGTVVRLDGIVQRPSGTNTGIFTLPAGFRPPAAKPSPFPPPPPSGTCRCRASA